MSILAIGEHGALVETGLNSARLTVEWSGSDQYGVQVPSPISAV